MSSAPANSKRDDSKSIPANRYVTFVCIALVGAGLDLLTKYGMFSWLGMPSRNGRKIHWIWEGFFGFETSVNQGALFGMGQGMSFLFGVISIVFGLVIVLWLFRFGGAHDRLLTIALACVMAGIFGNLYDRMGLWHGADVADFYRNGVRDWILFKFGNFNWPNFNIADSFLVCGAGLLMIHALRAESTNGSSANEKESTATA